VAYLIECRNGTIISDSYSCFHFLLIYIHTGNTSFVVHVCGTTNRGEEFLEQSQSSSCNLSIRHVSWVIISGNGIPIWIQDERDVAHFPIGRPLLELNTKFLESLASFLDIIDSNSNVAKSTARVAIPVCVSGEGRIGLCAMVVRQLQDAFACEALLFLLLCR